MGYPNLLPAVTLSSLKQSSTAIRDNQKAIDNALRTARILSHNTTAPCMSMGGKMDQLKCTVCEYEFPASAAYCSACGAAKSGEVHADAPGKGKVNYELALFAIPSIGTLLIWFWIGSMNLLRSPESALTLVGLATVLGTALVAAMEANAIGMVGDKEKGTNGPVAWFFAIALIWILAYPSYMFKRKLAGLPNRLGPGVLLAAVFTGSLLLMTANIEHQKAQVRASLDQWKSQISGDAAATMNDIWTKAADDAITQHDIAKHNDSAIDACVEAGVAAGALLQAKDEEGYRKWKAVERADCSAAGMPRQ
jgi:hypothetical protein